MLTGGYGGWRCVGLRRPSSILARQGSRSLPFATREAISAGQRVYRDANRGRLRVIWANNAAANRERDRAEAAVHGLKNGDDHPVTGRRFNGSVFHTHATATKVRFSKLVSNAKKRAEAKGRLFDITPEYVESLWPADGLCRVLGTPLVWGTAATASQSPTLDRIDSAGGYARGNLRIISHRANTLRNNATLGELRRLVQDAERLEAHKPDKE